MIFLLFAFWSCEKKHRPTTADLPYGCGGVRSFGAGGGGVGSPAGGATTTTTGAGALVPGPRALPPAAPLREGGCHIDGVGEQIMVNGYIAVLWTLPQAASLPGGGGSV